jgi:hypothetical protein
LTPENAGNLSTLQKVICKLLIPFAAAK